MIRRPGHYPPSNEIASPTELRELYDKAVAEIKDYKNSVKIANFGSKKIAQEKEKYKQEAKIANRHVITLTKKQKAAQEANKSTMWSGAAAIAVTVLYETWKVAGFPGGNKWMEWWNHEAVYGIMMWITTIFFAQMYKMSKGQ